MREEIITSKENASVKLAAALLSRRREREQTGLFVAEGLRLCIDAAESGIVIQTLLLTKQAAEKWPETERLRQTAGRTLIIADNLAEKIADTQSTQGVFAVCEKLDIRRCAATIKGNGRYLLLESVQDPGNLGAMLRTADALGVDGVFLNDTCADPFGPKALRASMGGAFRVPLERGGLSGAVERLVQAGLPVYAARLDAKSLTAGSVDFSSGGAILIGNEGGGVSPELAAMCTSGLTIPMAEGANSLNAAAAAAILIWEMKR